ncbi:type II toxin-antitoxin system HicB family antitoxin [Methylogaea oryzae]|uniref:type II toxin-antitoxin system HicB family antitoxin n=1 Tax=Methylogaea oryzae TaxID=1295382 RepID=UPI0020D1B034|nr:hypothetical protein [Methylogaea oryzae]
MGGSSRHPRCATQGETFEDLLQNLYQAVDACMSVDVDAAALSEHDHIMEIAV